MAINTRKISSLNSFSGKLTGDEYIMVAYNNKSYKLATSVLISDIIKSIDQTIVTGDDKNNVVTITMGDGKTYSYNIKNGSKGSPGDKGEDGDKGERGDSGVAIYNADYKDLVLNTLNGKSNDGTKEYTDKELTALILSAAQGVVLNSKLEELQEDYLSETEYNELLQDGRINSKVKYFIIEESTEE